MGGHWIELNIPPPLLEILQRRYNAYEHACNLGDYLTTFLYFVSYPGQVLETSRLLEKKLAPAAVAHRLIEQHLSQLELEVDHMEFVEGRERDAFLVRMAAGQYTQALKRTGFQRHARRLVGRRQEA